MCAEAMTNKEQINRNIGLAFDFVRHLISKPEDADKLPEEFELEFIEKILILHQT